MKCTRDGVCQLFVSQQKKEQSPGAGGGEPAVHQEAPERLHGLHAGAPALHRRGGQAQGQRRGQHAPGPDGRESWLPAAAAVSVHQGEQLLSLMAHVGL